VHLSVEIVGTTIMHGPDRMTVVYSMSLTKSCVSREVAVIVFEANLCLRALNIEAV